MKNRAVFAVLFCVVASAANSAFGGTDDAFAEGRGRVMGGPVASIMETGAMVGVDQGGMPADSSEAMVYSASVASPGQPVLEELKTAGEMITGAFSMPARGINWGVLHPHNAVDIAGRCGSPLYAVAPGKVIAVRAGWNGGYGNYTDIDHGNGIITRYSHAEKNIAEEGAMVAAGDVIARMGNTGDSTGCHVHFEVRGAAGIVNPFAHGKH